MSGENFFELLGISPAFDIAPQLLEAAYFNQQRLYHPDRFVGKQAAQRQEALQKSADINQAYNTIKNPLSRAQYLLHLQGISIGTEGDSIKPTPQLLMETMEWREKVAEAQDAGEIEKLDNELKVMVSESTQKISEAYLCSIWEPMAHEVLRLGYLIKVQEAVMQQKKRLEKQAV